MNVKNKRCIRNLSLKQLKATKSRNLIAIVAIALTTLLFTALFTISLSIISSYEEYSFRELGGYCHGTFKEVNEEQIKALSTHKKIKEYGLRTVCGSSTDAPFAKVAAEISWMDDNTAKWSYATPTTGRMPKNGMEVAMDTAALEKLGIVPKLGTQVELTYCEGNGFETDPIRTDVFTLVGFWEYDSLMPVHYINVSKEYVQQLENDYIAKGGVAFRTDMNVMLPSSVNIQETMEQIDTDLGYQWENRDAENCVRIGVNWGYNVTSTIASNIDTGLIVAISVFLLLIIFTGYLIIYNIFQISVSRDIRHYGLLKTIGTTPKQIKRIVRLQSLYLSIIGIPLGCILGYGIGVVLLPAVLSTSIINKPKASSSPYIFVGSAIFALITVLISCTLPARKAAKITSIEALRYTDTFNNKKKEKNTMGTKIGQMAFANLGRNRAKTILVVISMSLAIVLLNCVVMATRSFDSEKYVDANSVSDFIVGKTEYFRSQGFTTAATLTDETIAEIQKNTNASLKGTIYVPESTFPKCWVNKETFREISYIDGDNLEEAINYAERKDDLLAADLMLEGLDHDLFNKLRVFEGDLAPLLDPNQYAIAVGTSNEPDDGEILSPVNVGDTLKVTYIDEAYYIDKRTGKLADDTTPNEFLDYQIIKSHDVDYTVCAIVGIPFSISHRFVLGTSLEAVISSDAIKRDCGDTIHAMAYVFDTPNEIAERNAETFLANYTDGEFSELMYESKAILRENFEDFRRMFLLVGGVLCFVIGLVGILNFFNAILTGILTRRREFAILQSVGMTGKQLKQLLIYEGIFYAIATCSVSLILALIINPIVAKVFNTMFWFFSYHFTIWPVLAVMPILILIGIILPIIVYQFSSNKSIVERLRLIEAN